MSYDRARTLKAIELENAIVDLGLAGPVLTDDMKRQALAKVSEARGKRTDASKDTWTLVATFLADRFGPGSATAQAR
jgi:hypothetical protein